MQAYREDFHILSDCRLALASCQHPLSISRRRPFFISFALFSHIHVKLYYMPPELPLVVCIIPYMSLDHSFLSHLFSISSIHHASLCIIGDRIKSVDFVSSLTKSNMIGQLLCKGTKFLVFQISGFLNMAITYRLSQARLGCRPGHH